MKTFFALLLSFFGVQDKPNAYPTPIPVVATTTPVVKAEVTPEPIKVIKKETKKTVVSPTPVTKSVVAPTISQTIQAKVDSVVLKVPAKTPEQIANDIAQQRARENDAIIKANEERAEVAKKEISNRVEAERLQAKKDRMDAINLEIANLNAKYAKDLAHLQDNTITIYDKDMKITDTRNKYTNQYNALMAESQQLYYSK